MMDRFTRVLAGLLGRSARRLPASRRGWAAALLAEAGEVPAGAPARRGRSKVPLQTMAVRAQHVTRARP
jgi:hypothetical protein